MPLFNDVVNDVQAYLRSFTRDQELSTHLVVGINSSVTSMTVNDINVISKGRMEIDDETIWVDSVDRANFVANIAPYGRGMDGSTAAAHASGARIISQPLYPRKMVKDIINQVISGLAGQLYGVATSQLVSSTTRVSYDLPSTCKQVLSVAVEYDPNLAYDVEYIRRWKFDPNAQVTNSATGKSIYIYDLIRPTRKINVTYFVDPVQLSGNVNFSTSLLPASSYDVVVLGAASRLLATASSYMMSTRSVEAAALDTRMSVDASSAITQSKYLYGLYSQRLSEEKTRLLTSFVTRSHYTG